MTDKTAEQLAQISELMKGISFEQLRMIPAVADLLNAASEYTFNAIPDDAIADEEEVAYWDVLVQLRGKDSYAIIYRARNYNFLTKQWDVESLPSTRTDAYLRDHRRPLGEAVTVAQALSHTVTVSGLTAAGYAAVKREEPELSD